MSAHATELDLVGTRAWPAAEAVERGPWLLRATGGYTDRANSATPLRAIDAKRAASDIATIERFYEERSLPPKFQVSEIDATVPLRNVLERRGYVAEKPTLIRIADLAPATPPPEAPEGRDRTVVLTPRPTEEWFDLWWSVDGRGDEHRQRALDLLGRLPTSAVFASVGHDDRIASVALGVADGQWLGLFCAATEPSLRGQRLAGSITEAIIGWGITAGAKRAYCQVAADNEASLRLTDRRGFQSAYQYRYFCRPEADGPVS